MLNLFRSTVYIRIKPEQLSVLHVESGKEMTDSPALAIETKGGKSSIYAVGNQALTLFGQPNITVANGFKHPRTIIADFTVAETTLKYFLRCVLPWKLFSPSPIIVMHPLSSLEGGLTQVEIRALAELGMGAGGRKVYVWDGPELSNNNLHELSFTQGDGKLLYP